MKPKTKDLVIKTCIITAASAVLAEPSFASSILNTDTLGGGLAQDVVDTNKDFIKMSSSLGTATVTAWAFKSIRKSV